MPGDATNPHNRHLRGFPHIGWHRPKSVSTLVACAFISETDIVRGIHGVGDSREKTYMAAVG